MTFLYSRWRALPINVRADIARLFGIAKVGSTHVQDNVIVSDGYKIEDVERAISPENIAVFTGLDSDDPDALWDAMLHKVRGGETIVPEEPVVVVVSSSVTTSESFEPMEVTSPPPSVVTTTSSTMGGDIKSVAPKKRTRKAKK